MDNTKELLANQFYNTVLLIQTTNKDKKLLFGINKMYIIPFVVNCAFALEMFFKNELSKQGISYPKTGREGHNLQTLYGLLPQKSLVEAKYDELFDSVKRLNETKLPLSEVLDKIKFAFLDWRYLEFKDGEPPLPLHCLQIFTEAVKRTLVSWPVQPELFN